MPFDARRWPNAMTVADLVERGMGTGAHCQPRGPSRPSAGQSSRCGLKTPVPSLGCLSCTRCATTGK